MSRHIEVSIAIHRCILLVFNASLSLSLLRHCFTSRCCFPSICSFTDFIWLISNVASYTFVFVIIYFFVRLFFSLPLSLYSIRSKWERSIARQWMQFLNELNATHSKTRKKLQRMQMFHHSVCVFLYARRELCALRSQSLTFYIFKRRKKTSFQRRQKRQTK